MRIRIHDLEVAFHDRAHSLFADHEVFVTSEHLAEPEDCEALIVFISSKITRKMIDAMPSLRFIVTMSTGFDHIDMTACAERSITVMNVPSYGANTVAEHAFTLLLALARKLPESMRRVRSDLLFSTDASLRGFDLEGKRLGLIGLGKIGSHMARMARGFGMEVVVFDVFPNEDLAREVGCRFVSFDEMLSSDIISIHVPLNDHTRHLLDEDAFVKMKDGVILINTSRGGIIDTEALLRHLRSGKVSGAGLDVLEFESEIEDDIEVLVRDPDVERGVLAELALLRMPNVIITPHNAFNSNEAVERIVSTSFDNLRSALDGDATNVVHGS